MKPSCALLAVFVAGSSAHTVMSEIYIDGQAQGDATCVRMPMTPDNATDPVENFASTDMACGFGGMAGVDRVCSINGGSTMTFEYREWANDASEGSIDISHKGPCAVYLKKVDNAITDTAVGGGWFKIWDDGYDESEGKWCTEKIIDNDGHFSVSIPKTLQGGYYLVRSELLALHDADKTPSDPQFYIGCAQVFLDSSGSVLPDSADTVSIPGYIEADQPSVTFNIWDEPMALPYPMPGPSVFNAVASGTSHFTTSDLKQTQGLLASACVLVNANWCAVELSPYTTSDGCWNASTACWNQCTDCYGSAPPTGSTNCKIWEAKCGKIDAQCNAGNYNGPPDYMKDLTPALNPSSIKVFISSSSSQTGTPSMSSFVHDPQSSASLLSPPSSVFPVVTIAATTSAEAASVVTETEFVILTATATVSSGLGTRDTPALEQPSIDRRGTEDDGGTVQQPIGGGQTETMTVSIDGTCGGSVSCMKSSYGDCCNQYGFCGSGIESCGYGCQFDHGTCYIGINGRDEQHIEARAVGDTVQQPVAGGQTMTMTVSTDGTCGGTISCLTSSFGDCCSQYGFCGSGIDSCGYGCQFDYGHCDIGINGRSAQHAPRANDDTMEQSLGGRQTATMFVSTDGTCGGDITCFTSSFGDCCNQYNFCGSGIENCGYGCQFDYGHCDIGINGRDVSEQGVVTSVEHAASEDNNVEEVGKIESNPRWEEIQSRAHWHKKVNQRRVRRDISLHEREVAMMI